MQNFFTHYQPPREELWTGRADTLPGERFFQHIKLMDYRTTPKILPDNKRVIIGFCTDEGIARNEGRRGAFTGPDILRKQLGKLAYHGDKYFVDAGDIVCDDEDLESAQQQCAQLISQLHKAQQKTLLLGGGHEIAWGHFLGLQNHYPDLGIINFDAHFDLRPLPKNKLGTSGTPFHQIADFCRENYREFAYCCIGIQPSANTDSLFKTAEKLQTRFLTTEQINLYTLSKQLHFLDQFIQNHEAIYLTFCLDVLAASCAPGVSAPQPLGLQPWQILPLLKHVMKSGKIVSMDIAELSPPLDIQDQTARLAAMIAAELLEI